MRSKELAANRSAVTAGNPVLKEFFDLRGPLVALRGLSGADSEDSESSSRFREASRFLFWRAFAGLPESAGGFLKRRHRGSGPPPSKPLTPLQSRLLFHPPFPRQDRRRSSSGVEQRIRNAWVGGSIPPFGWSFFFCWQHGAQHSSAAVPLSPARKTPPAEKYVTPMSHFRLVFANVKRNSPVNEPFRPSPA